MKSPQFAAIIAMLVGVAGCADAGSPANVAQSEGENDPSAPQVQFDETQGTVHGVVTDEELSPIANARVTLREANLIANTTIDGSFVISHVPPGSHQLFVEALGYQ